MVGFSRDLFLCQLSSDIICILCHEVLSNPQKCPNNHLFCDSCIRMSLRKCGRKCPVCRHKLFLKTLTPADDVRFLIQGMASKCNKTCLDSSVCSWNGPSLNWNNHVCEHDLIGCKVSKFFVGFGTFVGNIQSLEK
jgi:hypothetical protein